MFEPKYPSLREYRVEVVVSTSPLQCASFPRALSLFVAAVCWFPQREGGLHSLLVSCDS
jgi:hypothetical protein